MSLSNKAGQGLTRTIGDAVSRVADCEYPPGWTGNLKSCYLPKELDENITLPFCMDITQDRMAAEPARA